MQETIFILGREPELSVAELERVAAGIGGSVTVLSTDAALLAHPEPLPERFLDRLGGSIKHVDVIDRWPIVTNVVQTMIDHLTGEWALQYFPGHDRIEFGLSLYGASKTERAAATRQGLRLKKALVTSDRPVRLITSRDPQLSAVLVQKNHLLTRGKEFVGVVSAKELIIGTTSAVQDFESYSLRDFGRPAANAKSGMLPPKLAQMMLNIAGVQPDDVVLDPFCGSGTVLQEASFMGIKKIFGSDLESRAVRESQDNIRWFLQQFPRVHSDIEITLRDARQVTASADVIVTEPYLGKPLRGHEPSDWLHQQAKDLQVLYLRCFEHWKSILHPGARVVMIWPEFMFGDEPINVDIELAVSNLGFYQEPLLSSAAAEKLRVINPGVLTYARQDARVRRQIRRWVRQ